MKILMLHNYYRSRGGEDISFEVEARSLKDAGIDVDVMTLDNRDIRSHGSIRTALGTLWSWSSYKKVRGALKDGGYDILHVQNFFPLFSPSILYAAWRSRVKVVMAIRNYRLVCPNGLMFRDGDVCSSCRGRTFPVNAIKHKCYRSDFGASVTVTAMLALHNLLGTFRKRVDAFICVSNHVRDQLVLGGFDPAKLFVKYNPVPLRGSMEVEDKDYFLFVGRLAEEKGVRLLKDTFSRMAEQLVVVGDGPLRKEFEDGAESPSNVHYLGRQPLETVYGYMAGAKAVLVTSLNDEPFGRVVVESLAQGTPCIVSDRGGMKELVTNDVDGYVFRSDAPASLDEAIHKINSLTGEDYQKMRENARKNFRDRYAMDTTTLALIGIYHQVLRKKNT